jgi:SAM-dependent methyltransferase
MADDYTKLAPVYDTIGLDQFSMQMISRILDYALQNDWLGQRIVDFGCGTGSATLWLAEGRYSVTGIDNSEDMLTVAREKSSAADWELGDIRSVNEDFRNTDLVFSFNVINEINSIKEVRAVFESAFRILNGGQLFFFDSYTLEGLTRRGEAGHVLVHDSDGVMMFSRNTFDYERQLAIRNHTTFIQGADGTWLRQDTTRVVRAFPVQVIAGLLQRVGFESIQVTTPTMAPVAPTNITEERVIFVARKPDA